LVEGFGFSGDIADQADSKESTRIFHREGDNCCASSFHYTFKISFFLMLRLEASMRHGTDP
jgi:hypothetical protein